MSLQVGGLDVQKEGAGLFLLTRSLQVQLTWPHPEPLLFLRLSSSHFNHPSSS